MNRDSSCVGTNGPPQKLLKRPFDGGAFGCPDLPEADAGFSWVGWKKQLMYHEHVGG